MFRKLFYRLIILGFVGLLAAPFILKDPEGQPLMTPKQFFDFDMSFIKTSYRTAINILRGLQEPSNVTKLYKWQDENGEWHFGDKTAEGFQGEEVRINNNQNVLSFDDVKAKLSEATDKLTGEGSDAELGAQDKQGSSKQDKDKSKTGGGGYVKKLTNSVSDAQNVQNLIDKNHQEKVKQMERY